MKIRLAKKIMKCDGDVSRWYWAYRLAKYCEQNTARYYNDYRKNENTNFKSILRCDHRITKAINLSAKCKARDMLHNIEKNGCRNPFNQKNVESCRRKVESYKV